MLMSNVGFARLSDEARKDEAVKHAFAVHVAVSLGNYCMLHSLDCTKQLQNSPLFGSAARFPR